MSDEIEIKSLLFPLLTDAEQGFALCPNCKEVVTINSSKQKNMDGHKCESCHSSFVIVMCPYCKSIQQMDAEEWDTVRNLGKHQCIECNAEATLKVKKFGLKLSPTIMTAVLGNWSGTESEEKLIAQIQRLYTEKKIEQLAQIHHAVGARLKSARLELDALKTYGIKTLEIFNNHELKDINGEHKRDVETSAFIISNALISSLEILIQELVRVLRVRWESRYIGFTKAVSDKRFQEKSKELQIIFDDFSVTDEYRYLSKLRRCIHHYQLIPLSIDSTFTIEIPGSIVEQALPATHIVYLPDNPITRNHSFTFNQQRELNLTLSNIANKIEKLALDSYGCVSTILLA